MDSPRRTVKFPEELAQMVADFLVKAPGWEEVDQWIRDYRDTVSKVPDSTASTLMAISSDEVDYSYAMWREDFDTALAKARLCADALGGPDHAPYRAWWYYLAGSAAWISASRSGDDHMAEVAREMFTRASSAAPAVTWFGELARTPVLRGKVEQPADPMMAAAVENIENHLSEVGVVGRRFEREVTEFLELIDSDEAAPFERGLEQLGAWLGFDAIRPGRTGDPDGIWRLGDFVILALEAKSGQSEEDPVSLANARETQGHLNWIKTNLEPTAETNVFGVIVSPRSSISREALPQCESLYLMGLSQARITARQIVDLVRGIRVRATEESSEALKTLIRQRLTESGLDPARVLHTLKKLPLPDLPVMST